MSTEEPESRAFGKYQSFAKLGAGGMGDVVLAVARGLVGFHKLVVLKRLRPELAADPAFLSMFLDEARLAARLSHPNVVHTYEIGEDAGTYFIAMEYLEGQPLVRVGRTAAARARFTPAMWAHVIARALAGLHHAHELCDYDGAPLRVVHRDVSPQNIFITYGGEVKVVDFGIAKAETNSSRTATGMLKGKLSYMAPEQASGTADRRSDVFAMGVVLWEMLAGRKLFAGETVRVLDQLLHQPIPRVASVRADVGADLDEIVARALARDPGARYQTAAEMAEALEAVVRASGEVVRDAGVGAVVAEVFADVRVEVQQKIQAHMAGAAAEPGTSGFRLPTLTGPLSPSTPPPPAVASVRPPPLPMPAPEAPAEATLSSIQVAAPLPAARGRAAVLAGVIVCVVAAGALLLTRRDPPAPAPLGASAAPSAVAPPAPSATVAVTAPAASAPEPAASAAPRSAPSVSSSAAPRAAPRAPAGKASAAPDIKVKVIEDEARPIRVIGD